MLNIFHKKTIFDKIQGVLKSKPFLIISGIAILLILGIWVSWRTSILKTDLGLRTNKENEPAKPIENKKALEINSGDTYGQLLAGAGIEITTANEIFKAAAPVYGLEKIRAGHALELIYDANWTSLDKLVYKIDSEDELVVAKNASSTWQAEIKPIEYEVKTVVKSGEVKTSMYAAALENNIDERAIIALADAFQWTIDFALDPRVGDKFKFVYEERYLDGKYAMPGRVFAGSYINGDQPYNVYYFSEDEANTGYFDENGNSAQKMFLKAPVSFKYISSSFTTGMRYVEAFNVSTGHRAVDYAATAGTPIRTVGDGTVIFASYNGAYGNMVKVQHNGTYTTNYGHMSKFAVKRGAKVKQGQTIGYVGSTGFSTGPHLHFEMVKNGVKINPLKEITPPGKAIKPENKDRFVGEIKKWQDILK